MSAAPILTDWGAALTDTDYQDLAARWITPELADNAGLRRADSLTGRQMFGRKRGDVSCMLIPNMAPWDTGYVREYRGRLYHAELEYRTDGTVREANKYIQPPERRNLIYFPPGITTAVLEDVNLPVIITEGEFKSLALRRLAITNGSESLRFVPIATAGVWNFRGTIGKATGPKGDRRDVKGIIPDIERIAWNGRRVIIAFDADSEQNSSVRAARWKLTSALTERGALVGFLEWPISEGKGIDDRLAMVGPDKVLADIAAVEFGDWHTRLIRNEGGSVLPCYDNVALFLENSPEWSAVLGYNEFTGGYFILKPAPSPITAEAGSEVEDHFDTEVVRWLERKRLMVKPELVRRVVDLIARRNSYHPVRDYLESLPAWDGVPRIGTWLLDYCGVESGDQRPNHYAMAVGEKFLIAAVKRIMDPGAKCDSMLVLEGPQGIGKSTVPRILAGDEWFSDKLSEMGSKDASMQLRGIWIMELGELEALNRAELAQAKMFMSQQIERFRLPYGRRVIQVPRQCVFIGTTNSDAWLKDETGGRRFWPVRCHRIDLNKLRCDRDQLWAEALVQCRSGATWWLDDEKIVEDAVEEQRARYMEDVWHPKVIEHAETVAATLMSGSKAGTVSISDILQRLGVDVSKQDQTAANRVSRCLRAERWERRKVGPRGDREWRYRKVSQS
jgi:predicted P-loop ATPase